MLELRTVVAFVCVVWAWADSCQEVPGPKVRVLASEKSVILANGLTCIAVSLDRPRISDLRADFTGKGQYGKSVLSSGGMTLERLDAEDTVLSSADAGSASAKVTISSDNFAEVVINGLRDAAGNSTAMVETWTVSLAAGARSVSFSAHGSLQRDISAKALRHSFAFEPTSIYGLFDRGVVQMKGYSAKHLSSRRLRTDGLAGHYASKDGLARFYALGGSGEDLDTAGNASVAVRRGIHASAGVVLLNSDRGGPSGFSGFQEVLAGNLPEQNMWSNGWAGVSAVQLSKGLSWKVSYEIAPNNFDFPAQGPFGDVATKNIADRDLQAMLTGIYGSPVGQLCTHDNGVVKGQRVGQMATTIARPNYGYENNYNFFDPDNYLSTAAMLFSGDPYLQEQVRTVLERNGAYMNDKGQLPHHFVGVVPTYQALSGETQTGPNVFWVLSCLNYAKLTGNIEWLRGYMPRLRNASAFLFEMIHPEFRLLKSPGSLMIDVFIRNNFATDTNAMAVGFLQDFADAEEAIGNVTGATHLRNVAAMVAEATDAMLWSNGTKDHYVTQLNPDGTSRDFVDYDANLIALAHGIPAAERAKRVLARIDGGRCIHGRATFVSELYYGKHDTTGGNIGDSWCTMGRIGWFDALARKRYGDQATFDNLLLDPLVGDVNRWTWLHERYQCDGRPMQNRTSHYFEYPSVTAMMLHFVRYGIQLGFGSVKVTPFGPKAFAYHVGNIHVDYDAPAGAVRFSVPGEGRREITVEGLAPGKTYNYGAGPGASSWPWLENKCAAGDKGRVIADRDGTVNFVVHVGDARGPCVVDLRLAELEFTV